MAKTPAVASNTERDWEIEDAARILVRAEEIKADSKLHTAAQKLIAKQAEAAQRAMAGTRVGKKLMDSK